MICGTCKEDRPLDLFSWKSKEKGTRQSRCKLCQRQYSNNHYTRNSEKYKSRKREQYRNDPEHFKEIVRVRTRTNRLWLKEYLLTHPCECGESDIEVLQFDHVTPLHDWKAARVGKYIDGKLERLQKEVAKCVVRCANCHVRITRRQLGWSWDKYN